MFRLKFRLEKDAILDCPKYPPTIKATPKNKNQQNNAFCLPPPLPPPSLVFRTKFTTSELKSKKYQTEKYSTQTVNELGPPVLESSTRISKFYAPTDFEHKFDKTEIENCLPIG